MSNPMSPWRQKSLNSPFIRCLGEIWRGETPLRPNDRWPYADFLAFVTAKTGLTRRQADNAARWARFTCLAFDGRYLRTRDPGTAVRLYAELPGGWFARDMRTVGFDGEKARRYFESLGLHSTQLTKSPEGTQR